jgi:hypothetical protein
MEKTKSKKSPPRHDSSSLLDTDIFSDSSEIKGTSLFLGRYTMNEVSAVLSKRNFFKEAKKRKLWPLDFYLDSSEFPVQGFQIFYQRKKPENMIVDLKIRERVFRPGKEIESQYSLPEYKFLFLEWLTLQNPLLNFSSERSPLPGQMHPGLNLGNKVLDIFLHLARLTKKDGLLAFPAYFHNALLFSRKFHFIDPKKQGEILAIRKSLFQIPFKQMAWIVYLNCLKDKEGRIYEWKAEEMVFPINKALRKYFGSRAYKEKVKKTQERLKFNIDWICYKKQIEKEGLEKLP